MRRASLATVLAEISLDEIVGAEILIEGAVFQHVVDGREN